MLAADGCQALALFQNVPTESLTLAVTARYGPRYQDLPRPVRRELIDLVTAARIVVRAEESPNSRAKYSRSVVKGSIRLLWSRSDARLEGLPPMAQAEEEQLRRIDDALPLEDQIKSHMLIRK